MIFDKFISVKINNINVMLIKKQGKIYALLDRCPHMWCLLSGGKLEGYIIECPCHLWKYDIRTGEFVTAKEIKIPIYETKIEDKKVFVKM